MFKCVSCIEKDKLISFLKEQNKDLYDRLMAFNKDAFLYYKAETKTGPPLYPTGVDKNGEKFSYEDTSPIKARDEIFRAMGEETITVDEPENK